MNGRSMNDRTVPAEKIEEVIAILEAIGPSLRAEWTVQCLRALLPPPLVIEPGRWYRTRDGRKALVGECGYAIVYPLGGPRGEAELQTYLGDGRFSGAPSGYDLIAPWEDTDAT